MSNEHTTDADSAEAADHTAERERAKDDYNITAEIFIGTMVSAMGLLVLITPLFTEMPQDFPVSATLVDVIIGAVYLAIGGLVFSRAWMKARRR